MTNPEAVEKIRRRIANQPWQKKLINSFTANPINLIAKAVTSKKTLYGFHHKAFLSSNELISIPDKQAQILKIAQQAR